MAIGPSKALMIWLTVILSPFRAKTYPPLAPLMVFDPMSPSGMFLIRIPECIAKIDRMDEIYATIRDTPQAMKDELAAQRTRLEKLRAAKGEYISPFDL